jgi:hypothetical protein
LILAVLFFGIVFTKKAWEAVGKHPLENAGYDMTFIEKIHALDYHNILRKSEEVT